MVSAVREEGGGGGLEGLHVLLVLPGACVHDHPPTPAFHTSRQRSESKDMTRVKDYLVFAALGDRVFSAPATRAVLINRQLSRVVDHLLDPRGDGGCAALESAVGADDVSENVWDEGTKWGIAWSTDQRAAA